MKRTPAGDRAAREAEWARHHDWQTRVVRQGFLFQPDGSIFEVPRRVWGLFREEFPDLGLDAEADEPRPRRGPPG